MRIFLTQPSEGIWPASHRCSLLGLFLSSFVQVIHLSVRIVQLTGEIYGIISYNVIPNGDKKLPTLKIQFIGADLDLDSNRIFEVIDNMLCIIIMPVNERGPSLL